MAKAKTPISQAASYHEVGDYWDEHDLGEVWEHTKPVDADINIQSSITYFPIESRLSDKLRELAKQRGVSPETLLNLWVQEKTQDEISP